MKQTILSFLLMLLPMLASADESGMCGENVTWTYEESTKTLTISGSGDMYNYNYYDFLPFNGREDIQKVVIESEVSSIGDRVFSDCSSLTSITIPNSVTSIGSSAFSGCNGLTSIMIPNSVSSIGISAFSGCSSLTSITIPNSVTSIENRAFSGCSSLTSITIPNSVTSIGSSAFENCSGLTSFTIPSSVTSIEYRAFYGCSSLTSVTIPNSVTSIGSSAFDGCNLESAYIYIDDLAAWCETGYSLNCEQHLYVGGEEIKELIIPDNVASIRHHAFYSCSSLTSVTIPDGVTSIGSEAFKGCSSLTKISIGRGVNSIGLSAFANCTSLEEVYCYSEQFPQSSGYRGLFSGSPIDLATLYVPAMHLNTYKTTYDWSDFKYHLILEGGNAERCAKPTISLKDGEITFDCETPDASFVSSYETLNTSTTNGNKMTLPNRFRITVFAQKYGLLDSPAATAEIEMTLGASGDVNGDGKVDVADHVKLSDIIMNK